MQNLRRIAILRVLVILGLLCSFWSGFSSCPREAVAERPGAWRTGRIPRPLLSVPISASTPAARPLLTAPPRPDHVVIVVEENHSYSEIIQGSSAPYVGSLSSQGVLFTNYFAQYHPSEQNYLELLSGSDQGIGNTDPVPAPGSPFSTANWGGDLPSKGFSFKGFSEGLPSTGYSGGDTGRWVYRHCPWIAFQGTGTHQIPPSANVAFSSFPTDFTTLPTVCMVTPNLDDDMHDGTIQQGDTWLSTNLDAYARWAKTHNSLLIVVWDEDDGSEGNQVALVMVGQGVQAGIQNTQLLNHDSLCRLVCDMYGLTPMANAAGATPITGIWSAAGSPPVVATPASASPNPVSGQSTSLGVLGSDAGGEASLKYTWSATGPAAVAFSPDGTNAAKNATATFVAAGSYTLTCAITNSAGLSTNSGIGVTVQQTPASVSVTPANVSVVASGSQQFAAFTHDQFGHALGSQPSFSWTTSGGGSVDTTGKFTAGGSAGGPFTITAVGGGMSGTAHVTVTSVPPILTTIQVTPAAVSVSPSATQQFGAAGLDQFQNPVSPQPAFGWTVSGGGTISGSGLFSAGTGTGGPFTVTASSGPLAGTAEVTVAVPVATSSGGGGGGGCGSLGLDLLASGYFLATFSRRIRRSLSRWSCSGGSARTTGP